ncbi:hypothetical protein [Roseofilum casamattae]|uniref:Uncharacterized protein n=1 Tax=Roseofilum casamattae BLCC-M143 TaxID=3022442 RepID=A0ABT7BXR4_9CYAN|nr:hypothetical protein [Roseofilum casamattae]MDJ1183984.1 hypothetical protein [Roseofilum casamattae BLCC-M143]
MLNLLSIRIQRLASRLVSSSRLVPCLFGLAVGLTQAAPLLAQTAPNTPGTPSSARVADGVYFYGESPKRDRIGSAYMVFEARQDRLVGAFYMPHSSFDCFYGTVTSQQLALNVINSYDRGVHPYQVALDPVAIANPTSSSFNMQPQGFHRIEAINSEEMRILNTCRQAVPN